MTYAAPEPTSIFIVRNFFPSTMHSCCFLQTDFVMNFNFKPFNPDSENLSFNYLIFPSEESSFNLSFILADKDNSEMCVVRSSVYVNEIKAREREFLNVKNHISQFTGRFLSKGHTCVSFLTVFSV